MTRDDILRMSFRQQLEAMDMKQTECAKRFDIPIRTVQCWALGERKPPDYVRLMIAEITGLIK